MSLRRLGDHAWMQYFKCGHTYVLYSVKNCRLLITLKCLYIIPNTGLALFAAATHCLDGLRSSETNTPKSLSSPTSSNSVVSPLSCRKYFVFVLCMPNVHHLALCCTETEKPFIRPIFQPLHILLQSFCNLHPQVLLLLLLFIFLRVRKSVNQLNSRPSIPVLQFHNESFVWNSVECFLVI